MEKPLDLTYITCPEPGCGAVQYEGCGDFGEALHLSRLNAWLAVCGYPPLLKDKIPTKFFVEPFVEPENPRDMEMMGS